jgi:8-oxo-dGTP diphosphatase
MQEKGIQIKTVRTKTDKISKKSIRGKDYIGVGVGAVILNREGKFFLAKRGPKAQNEPGTWEFPGGAVDFGETLAQAVKREVKEEFGIHIKPLKAMHPIDHLIPKEKQHWIAVGYIAKLISGKPKIIEPEKCTEIGWYSIKEIDKMKLSIAAQIALKEIKENYAEIEDFF